MDYIQTLKEEGFEEIYQIYLKRLYKLREMAMVRINNQNQSLFIKGVSKEGLLETGNEERVLYTFGELEWLQKF